MMSNNKATSIVDRTLWPTFALLIITFGFFEITNVDLLVQDHFYRFSSQEWLVNPTSALPKIIFYNGAKFLIIVLALALIILSVMRSKYRFRLLKTVIRRCDLIVVIATMAVAPSLIAWCKAESNVFCPYQIVRYGGDQPYVRVLESYPLGHPQDKKGRGFPAGHASGGFSLMALAGLATKKRGQAIGLGVGIFMGSAMGLYQMAKGAHYLSHTLITALFCWWIFLLMRKVFIRSGCH